jgi:hypothetical protein
MLLRAALREPDPFERALAIAALQGDESLWCDVSRESKEKELAPCKKLADKMLKELKGAANTPGQAGEALLLRYPSLLGIKKPVKKHHAEVEVDTKQEVEPQNTKWWQGWISTLPPPLTPPPSPKLVERLQRLKNVQQKHHLGQNAMTAMPPPFRMTLHSFKVQQYKLQQERAATARDAARDSARLASVSGEGVGSHQAQPPRAIYVAAIGKSRRSDSSKQSGDRPNVTLAPSTSSTSSDETIDVAPVEFRSAPKTRDDVGATERGIDAEPTDTYNAWTEEELRAVEQPETSTLSTIVEATPKSTSSLEAVLLTAPAVLLTLKPTTAHLTLKPTTAQFGRSSNDSAPFEGPADEEEIPPAKRLEISP